MGVIRSLVVLGLAACWASAAVAAEGDAATDRLIRQLGSPSFAERERATRRLGTLGEAALPRLRHAAASDPDAEVRRRAGLAVGAIEGRLLPVLVERVKKSRLTPAEKGKELSRLIRTGMGEKEVSKLLGFAGGFLGDGGSRLTSLYFEFGLVITFRSGRVSEVQVMAE